MLSKDIIIVGTGPAGLSAAIYCARAGLTTQVFGVLEKSNANKSHCFENYLGFPCGISGKEILTKGIEQAEKFGAKFVKSELVDVNQNKDGMFCVKDSNLENYEAKALIIATGLGFKATGIKNERAFVGKGVSFCATCDGFFFKNKNICVIGNKNFAGEEALDLLAYTKHVTVLSNGADFEFSKEMQKELKAKSVALVESEKVAEFYGESGLNGVVFADGSRKAFDGAFLALGTASASDFANKLGVARTGVQNAYLVVDARTGETNIKGVFAAGDCTGGNAQAAKSVGEGCNAGISAIKFVRGVVAYVDYGDK